MLSSWGTPTRPQATQGLAGRLWIHSRYLRVPLLELPLSAAVKAADSSELALTGHGRVDPDLLLLAQVSDAVVGVRSP
jgi:hypothetical protein